MDLKLIKDGFDAFASLPSAAQQTDYTKAVLELEPQALAGFALAIFASEPSSYTADAMLHDKLPRIYYKILDAVLEAAQTPGHENKLDAFVAANLWQFRRMQNFNGSLAATTESKKIIARAFSQMPSFGDSSRRQLINALSDAHKYGLAKAHSPGASPDDAELAGLPKYISAAELQSILDYIELSHTPAAGFAPRKAPGL